MPMAFLFGRKEGMKTITKWVVSYTKHNEVSITVKEVNPYIPLNRYLDKGGWYKLEGVSIQGTNYIVTSELDELKGHLSQILVTKIRDKEIVGLTDSDKDNIKYLATIYLRKNIVSIS